MSITLLSFSLLKAQMVTVDDPTPNAGATYTFTYITSNTIGTGTNTPNIFYCLLPPGYPSPSPLVPYGDDMDPYVTFKVDGIQYLCSDVFGTIGGAFSQGIQLSTTNATTGITINAGSVIEITISGLLTNPSSAPNYTFNWRTAEISGATTELFTYDLDLATQPTVTNITVDDPTLNAGATYTFTYTTSNTIGTGTSTQNIFYCLLPPGYPSPSPLVPDGDDMYPYVTFKVNGIEYLCSDIFGTIGGAFSQGIQLSTFGASTGITINAGSVIEITISGLLTNPSSASNYTFNWRTAENSGAATELFTYDLDFATLSTEDVQTLTTKLYPNPAAEFIQISNLKSNKSYVIYNLSGSKIKSGITSNEEHIDIRNFSKGLYFLKFEDGNTIKFIKE